MGFGTVFSLGLVALVAFLAGPISHFVQIAGVFLTPNPTVLGESQGPIYIEDTIHCEDVHHYRPANLLFTACEDDKNTRFSWFPPIGNLLPLTAQGSIHVVDPKTMKSTRLAFENFQGPFLTHGIDVIEDPEQSNAVYIYAVNHMPNPAYFEAGEPKGVHKSQSQVELFHHFLNSDSIRHVRSVNHPLIKTPNDIYAISPVSFYVTNDHSHRDGPMRLIEAVWRSAKWSNIIHVQIADLTSKDTSIEASVALTGLWNNNGLGHGRTENEVIISSAMGGEVFLATRQSNHSISINTSVSVDALADNPSYYDDPYRTDSHDASGYLVAGVSQAIRLLGNSQDPNASVPIPVQVWYMIHNSRTGIWEKKVLFEDDGSRISTASAAVLVPIEPKVGGKKLAWLFITGFMSNSMVAVQVEM